jgi:flagellar biogenesis protein FliO
MPPTAGIVGLMFALAGSACLAGQAGSHPGPVGAPANHEGRFGDESLCGQASRALQGELGLGPDHVKPLGEVRPNGPVRRIGEVGPDGQVESVGYDAPASGGNEFDAAPWPQDKLGPAQGGEEAPLMVSSPPDADATPSDDVSIRLPPPGQSARSGKTGVAGAGSLTSLVTVASSLGVVLGLFLVVAWAMRRTVPGGSVVLPSEVVEVLGRAALAGKTQVHLVRCGSKLLLVSLSPTGVETLTEITEPDEVTRLAGLCRQAQPGSTTAAFRQALQQFAGPRSASGLPGGPSDDVRLANAGVPGTRYRGLEGHDA